eukprot:5296734-Pleurochrysis_carterae.AAC.1
MAGLKKRSGKLTGSCESLRLLRTPSCILASRLGRTNTPTLGRTFACTHARSPACSQARSHNSMHAH